jgi:hypothetical protein
MVYLAASALKDIMSMARNVHFVVLLWLIVLVALLTQFVLHAILAVC